MKRPLSLTILGENYRNNLQMVQKALPQVSYLHRPVVDGYQCSA